MHRISISEIMTADVVTIQPDALAADAGQLMQDLELRRLPVVDEEGFLVGILTDSDVREAETAQNVLTTYEPDADHHWLTVAEVMTSDVVSIAPDATIGELAELLMKYKIGGVPVVDEEEHRLRLVGIVTETDIFRMIAEAWQEEKETNVQLSP
jgi:CBS domain-containing protein